MGHVNKCGSESNGKVFLLEEVKAVSSPDIY